MKTYLFQLLLWLLLGILPGVFRIQSLGLRLERNWPQNEIYFL
mgnify:CR=1 FL=1